MSLEMQTGYNGKPDEYAVYRWKREDHLFLWRYTEAPQQGWQLSADATACASIVDLVDRMLAADGPTHKRIPVSVPARMRVFPGLEWEPASALMLRYPKGQTEDEHWHAERANGAELVLTVGAAKLHQLRDAMLEMPNWKDDFALGPEIDEMRNRRRNHGERPGSVSQCIWFWTTVS